MAPIITDLQTLPAELLGAVLAIGNFDGVHRGHAQLISQLTTAAKSLGCPAVVMTFDPPPQAVLVPSRPLPPPLTSIPRRAELLATLGVDALIAYPTDKRLLALTARDFFQQVVVDQLQARGLVEGPNFRFGRDRAGDTRLLEELCQQQAMQFAIAEATHDPQGMISSTRIRDLLASGDVEAANALLTQPYEVSGQVASGSRRGRELGFPTANLTHVPCLVPAQGVYAGQVQLDGRVHRAAINIGPNPTFDEPQPKVEVHVIGWEGSLYDAPLRCTLTRRIREIRKFDSIAELRQQIERDVLACAGAEAGE